MTLMNEFWQACVQRLEQELPPQQINAWIRPLVPLDYDAELAVLRISAPNRFKLDWVRKNFSTRLESMAADWYSQPVQVQFELPASTARAAAPTPRAAPQSTAPVRAADAVAAAPAVGAPTVITTPEPAPAPVQAATEDSIQDHSRLNRDLTFDNFVIGKANQLARAAAMQVAENPGVSYNPLFLYGGVGLGKTHLIHAIGNALLASGASTRVRYVHADQYISDVVKAYHRRAFDDFKRYYHSLDLLLIDDIQFFAGKNRTQEEFFYAFEAMVAQRKQIIITSDTYPKELSNIDNRLISRFDWGLTVAI